MQAPNLNKKSLVFASALPLSLAAFFLRCTAYIEKERTVRVSFTTPNRTWVFRKLLLNGGWYDGKIGCIQFLRAELKILNFHFCSAQYL